MKYIVVLCDGAADRPIPELDGKTPFMVAKKPHMDFCAQHGLVGLAKTVPDSLPPGSDTANLSVMGYDPEIYYTGRSPLEAVSMGIDMAPEDVSFRLNVVTVSDEAEYEDKTMIDYSSGEITTEESRVLVTDLGRKLGTDVIKFYPGISYRHCLLWRGGDTGSILVPPHDITNRPVKDYLPKGTYGAEIMEIMRRSYEILKDHPINQDRIARGLNPANSAWIWGEGRKPALADFGELYGVKGAAISAVDLIKGIAICAGMESIDVPGATGNIDTDFAAKGKAAIDYLLSGGDFIYIHVEAPDESGHHAALDDKILSIEKIDAEILGPIMDAMQEAGEEYSVLITPDHPTPIEIQTHSREAVPFVLYRSVGGEHNGASCYDEKNAAATGLYIEKGCQLMKMLINK